MSGHKLHEYCQFPSHQTCYVRSVMDDATCGCRTCDTLRLFNTTSITLHECLIKIFSPDFDLLNSQYPDNFLCQYALPECPGGPNSIKMVTWRSEDFVLEGRHQFGYFLWCGDFVKLVGYDPQTLENQGVDLDVFDAMCGVQNDFSVQHGSHMINVSSYKKWLLALRLSIAEGAFCEKKKLASQLQETHTHTDTPSIPYCIL